MYVTLGQLRAFERIVRLGSFHAAAAELNLSQPSVSIAASQRGVDRGSAGRTAPGRAVADVTNVDACARADLLR